MEIEREGETLFVLNEAGINLWTALIQGGRRADGSRLTTDDAAKIAANIQSMSERIAELEAQLKSCKCSKHAHYPGQGSCSICVAESLHREIDGLLAQLKTAKRDSILEAVEACRKCSIPSRGIGAAVDRSQEACFVIDLISYANSLEGKE